jgi:hypothetical protein
VLDVSKLAAETSVVPGRSCGTCTMCCKLFDIPEIGATAGKWCRHCAPGKGCQIYDARPETCRKFFCGWMVTAGLGPEWKPDRCKVIMQLLAVENTFWVNAYADESYPAAWQRPDIYKKLKQIAAANPAVGETLKVVVTVLIGRRRIVVLPDRDVDAGIIAADEELAVTARNGLINVQKVKRARGIEPAKAAASHPI